MYIKSLLAAQVILGRRKPDKRASRRAHNGATRALPFFLALGRARIKTAPRAGFRQVPAFQFQPSASWTTRRIKMLTGVDVLLSGLVIDDTPPATSASAFEEKKKKGKTHFCVRKVGALNRTRKAPRETFLCASRNCQNRPGEPCSMGRTNDLIISPDKALFVAARFIAPESRRKWARFILCGAFVDIPTFSYNDS